jgi:hypothetical protein
MKVRIKSSDVMDKFDILRRAMNILLKSPLTGSDAKHGEYCPYCAIAIAKGELDNEFDTGVTFMEALTQMVSPLGFNFDNEEDRPLIEAKESLNTLNAKDPPYLKKEVIEGFNLLLRRKQNE